LPLPGSLTLNNHPKPYRLGFFFLGRQGGLPLHLFIILICKDHIIILEHAIGMIKLSHAIRTSRYRRDIPHYSSYTRVKRNNNGSSVLAKKIIIQSLICIAIIFSVAFLQNRTEELPKNIISTVRLLLVERHMSTEDIYQTIADAYTECMDYIKGND